MLDLQDDPVFPALSRLTADDLERITGASLVKVLRIRHQPGARAVLHVGLGKGSRSEGVIWFFWPDKVARLREGNPHLAFDPATGALFEPFPTDHRLPEVGRFMQDRQALAARLLDAPPAGAPELLRYRPGLSATFRWVSQGGGVHFVKVARKAQVAGQARMIAELSARLEGGPLAVAGVAGVAPEHAAISYRAAEGRPFDRLMTEEPDAHIPGLVARLTDALGDLWSCRMPGLPAETRADYLTRAQRSAEIIAAADAGVGRLAQQVLDRCARQRVAPRNCPIHADLKPDHAFVSEARVMLIDTESLKLGDPDHDLALLDARLDIPVAMGMLAPARRDLIRQSLRRVAGADYGWYLALARLHSAKYFAQRPDPERVPRMMAVLTAG